MSTQLIPGFRFHPTDVELVKYFLKRKVMGKKFPFEVITELDVYQYSPWDLPDNSCLRSGDLEWYFFSPRGKKYGSGSRTNRATKNGYWKATGNDRAIKHNKQTVGMIKTLVYHTGKSPGGARTDWVMHEFKLEDKDLANKGIPQDSYVICKVFQKEGLGPRNGAQYGRPFNEQDWDDYVEVEMPSAALSAPVPIPNVTSNNSSPQNEQHLPATASGCIGPTCMSSLTGPVPSPDPANPSNPTSNQAVNNDDDDDILTLLDLSKEDSKLPEEIIAGEFFEDLGDLDNWAALSGLSTGQNTEHSPNQMMTSEVLDYVELIDLDTPLFWQNYPA